MLATSSGTPEQLRLAGIQLKAVRLQPAVNIIYTRGQTMLLSHLRPNVWWSRKFACRQRIDEDRSVFVNQRDQVCNIHNKQYRTQD